MRPRRPGGTTKEVMTMAKDPVCGMTVDEKTAIRAEHQGKTHYFCAAGCSGLGLPVAMYTSPSEGSTAAVGQTLAPPPW